MTETCKKCNEKISDGDGFHHCKTNTCRYCKTIRPVHRGLCLTCGDLSAAVSAAGPRLTLICLAEWFSEEEVRRGVGAVGEGRAQTAEGWQDAL